MQRWSSRVAMRFRRKSSASSRFDAWWPEGIPRPFDAAQGRLRARSSASIHEFVWTRVADLFIRPALLQHALKVRLDDPLVAHLESREELEDGLARALDEAAGLSMGDRAVTADHVQRELDD